jgi:TPR repeat protein
MIINDPTKTCCGQAADVRVRRREIVMNPYRFCRCSIILCIFALIVFLSGCASQNINLGVNAYNQGNYDLAAKYWNPLAKQGNYIAQFNLGLLWEQGLGSTPLNKAEASIAL